MKKKLSILFTLLVTFIFFMGTSPVIAASSDKKKTTKTSAVKKKAPSSKKAKAAAKTASAFKGSVNVNKATKEELMQLPGIGDVKAKEIIKTRKKSGKFKNAEDLLKVNGIGEQTLKGIKKNLKF